MEGRLRRSVGELVAPSPAPANPHPPRPDGQPRRGRRRGRLWHREHEQRRARRDPGDPDHQPHVRDRLLRLAGRDLPRLVRRTRSAVARTVQIVVRRARRITPAMVNVASPARPRTPPRCTPSSRSGVIPGVEGAGSGGGGGTAAPPSGAPDSASTVSAVLCPAVSVSVRRTGPCPWRLGRGLPVLLSATAAPARSRRRGGSLPLRRRSPSCRRSGSRWSRRHEAELRLDLRALRRRRTSYALLVAVVLPHSAPSPPPTLVPSSA